MNPEYTEKHVTFKEDTTLPDAFKHIFVEQLRYGALGGALIVPLLVLFQVQSWLACGIVIFVVYTLCATVSHFLAMLWRSS